MESSWNRAPAPGRRRPALYRAIAAVCMMVLLPLRAATSRASDGGWSAEVLKRILEAAPPEKRAARTVKPGTEMTLHTYRFTHLRVGAAGKPRNVLAILGKLLPPGSSVTPDIPANSIHVMTTPAAHEAIWDYLSAVDVPDPATLPRKEAIPDEVRSALQRLADTNARSQKLVTALASFENNVSGEISRIDAREQRALTKLIVSGAALSLLVFATFAWLLRRLESKRAGAPPPATGALALAPEQLKTALIPVHDKMRSDMLGLLNEVAIKLQAQHNEQREIVREQQKQIDDARQALIDERRQFLTDAGSMVVQAVERVDATTTRLSKQQDKVADLVQELEQTVRELDQTKDNLRSREIELEQERAKIAALSILLEEGGTGLPAPQDGFERRDARRGSGPATGRHPAQGTNGAARPAPESFPACKNPEQTNSTETAAASQKRNNATGPAPEQAFVFLPPDHPEI